MKITFDVRYGKNTIEIPDFAAARQTSAGLERFFNKTVTIYSDIQTAAESRHFDRRLIHSCTIQGSFSTGAPNGATRVISNKKSIITIDINHYVDPAAYKRMPVDEREGYYTVQVGDFVVFHEVDDVVTNEKEWANLRQKYSKEGFKVAECTPYLYGEGVDNIMFTA